MLLTGATFRIRPFLEVALTIQSGIAKRGDALINYY
jgi:hypothetical protein